MIYTNCKLYKLNSKKVLKYLLAVSDNNFFKQKYVASQIEPYIDTLKKPRLIEKPSEQLKAIQSKIKGLLYAIQVPDNVFSGIKGRSYSQNAQWHKGTKHVYKIDLTAFFPSITREKVYSFFKDDLETSSDVAEIITNITTVDIDLTNLQNVEQVNEFLISKNVKTRNHLISGAPTSQILSYMANHKMFDEIQSLANHNGIVMTIYVDDITFSSENYISNKFKNKVQSIIKKYGYQISARKVKSYSKCYPKLVTGAIIDKNGCLTVKNSLRYKIMSTLNELKENPNNKTARRKLRGLVIAARQIEPNAYPSVHKLAFDKKYKVN